MGSGWQPSELIYRRGRIRDAEILVDCSRMNTSHRAGFGHNRIGWYRIGWSGPGSTFTDEQLHSVQPRAYPQRALSGKIQGAATSPHSAHFSFELAVVI